MIDREKIENNGADISPKNETQAPAAIAENQYQDIAELTTFSLAVPMAMVNLMDENRQWLYVSEENKVLESGKRCFLCNYAIQMNEEVVEIPDIRLIDSFEENFLNSSSSKPIVYYAAYILKDARQNKIGTLCVFDDKPRTLNQAQKGALMTMGRQVEVLYELNEKNKELRLSRTSLKQHNNLLKSFAGAVSHDLKMPLASIIMTVDILKTKYKNEWDETALDYLKRLKQSSLGMSEYITHILDYYETENISSEDYTEEPFNLKEFLENIIDMLNIDKDCEINLPEVDFDMVCNRSGLEQIFLNLLVNSLKYNDKEKTIIDIAAEEKKNRYLFKITDNGMGISPEDQEKIFDLFSIATERDRYGRKGNGIGLSTVQKIVHKLEGDIHVESVEGQYTSFIFDIKKQKLRKKTHKGRVVAS